MTRAVVMTALILPNVYKISILILRNIIRSLIFFLEKGTIIYKLTRFNAKNDVSEADGTMINSYDYR